MKKANRIIKAEQVMDNMKTSLPDRLDEFMSEMNTLIKEAYKKGNGTFVVDIPEHVYPEAYYNLVVGAGYCVTWAHNMQSWRITLPKEIDEYVTKFTKTQASNMV